MSLGGGNRRVPVAEGRQGQPPSDSGRHFKQAAVTTDSHESGSTSSKGTPRDAAARTAPKPTAPAQQDEPLRRVKKRRHPALKMLGIGCGSLLALVLVFVAIFAVWFGGLSSSMQVDDEQERQDLEDSLADTTSDSDAFYTLILGRDARPGDDASRSDVIMLARIDPKEGTVSLISIPRDTMVTINGETQKINAAYAFSGAGGAVRCISQFAGVDITHYVSIDFEGLVEVVDMLGGVWVDVPESFSTGTYTFEAGEQLLTGDEALAFARDRYHVSGGDFGRAQAQRILVEAIVRQVLASSPIELPGLISKLASCITTDLSAVQLVELAQQFVGKDLTMYSAICPSYTLYQDGVSYVGTMFDEWRRMMQLTDAGLDPNSETAEIPEAQQADTELGAASNSPAPRDYQGLAENAMTTDDVAAAS